MSSATVLNIFAQITLKAPITIVAYDIGIYQRNKTYISC